MVVAWNFPERFRSLTDYAPMRWQCRLFERFVENELPEACDIPTGLGKTSVMIIWLLALVQQAKGGCVQLPRRLIYVVNRRTVVDQATSIVERIRRRLLAPEEGDWNKYAATLKDIASALRRLCALDDREPLGISTLRGELADNEEWKTDPARPAIVVGTIDMIGSKLLFSGYGDGRYWRSHHPGLIGQDALIVHDEAHLTPAFSEVLRGVVREQERSAEPRRVEVIELSATQRSDRGDIFRLEPDDESDGETGPIVRERLDAEKRLRLHRCADLVDGIVEKAKSHFECSARVLIYLRSPDDAQRVTRRLAKSLNGSHKRVALLTGTIRGYERDRLVAEDPVFRAFLDRASPVQESVFLVSTSAGEIGVDIDADHMICDVAALDSMIQRLGRVNRRGGPGRAARVDVVWREGDVESSDDRLDKAVRNTLELLRRWIDAHHEAEGLLVSPRRIRELIEQDSPESREEAFSPKPTILPLMDILLDNWSMTSIDDLPGQPEVAAYLHGLTTDPPETFVVWRKEIRVLAKLAQREVRKAQREFEETLSDWFGACRIQARERLRDVTSRVRKKLQGLLESHSGDFPVVLLDGQGRARWSTLSAIAEKPKDGTSDVLAYRTVVLPVEADGLDRYGMFTGKLESEEDAPPSSELDVAEFDGQRARKILCQDGKDFWLQDIEGMRDQDGTGDSEGEEPGGDVSDKRQFDSPEDAANAYARDQGFVVARLIALNKSDDEEEREGKARYLLLMLPAKTSLIDDPERARFAQTLDDHANRIVQHADQIVRALNLTDELHRALVFAARWHDRGKDRPVWQRFAGNDNLAHPLAKSTRYLDPRVLGGYRHEFGSLLEAVADNNVHNDAERDLILHLIAAHHGWGRPHFERRAFDHQGQVDPSTGNRWPPSTAHNETVAIQALQRFGRLQQRFGRWGLAWLESLLRCADIAASRPPYSLEGAPAASCQPLREEVGA